MNYLFWFGIVFTLIAPIVIGTGFGDHSTSWVAALCGAFVTFVAKLESVAELSLGPVKARMREQLKEANATIKQLRDIAVTAADGTLTNLIAGAFMGGMSLEKRLEIHEKVIESLKEIGASDKQIDRAEIDWRKGISIIYHRAIRNAVESRSHPSKINTEATKEQKEAGKELQDALEFEHWKTPTPEEIRNILRKHNVESSDAEKWISDYEHFLETNEIRNKDDFISV